MKRDLWTSILVPISANEHTKLGDTGLYQQGKGGDTVEVRFFRS